MNDQSPVTNLITTPALQGLANAINRTYTYANNSYFGALIPNFYRDYYYRNIQIACGWLDGYVWSLHSSSGIISTRIGTKLITGLTKQVVGERLVFRKASSEPGYETLRFVSKWAKDQDIIKAVYAGIGFALGVGTSLLKINRKMNGDLWWEAIRFDNCFFLSSFTNEIQEATFYIRGYTDTRPDKSVQQFVLVEHRYYNEEEKGSVTEDENGMFVPSKIKGTKTAMVEYRVHRCKGTSYNNLNQTDVNSKGLKWQELPDEIRKMIRRDFGAIRVGEPQKLGLPNLGVVALRNGEVDLSVPTGTSFGEGMLIGIQDDMICYEVATSYQIRDMYLGKGTVYVPKDLNINDFNPALVSPPGELGAPLEAIGAPSGVLSGIGEDKIETVKGVSPDQQKIMVEQFQIRGQEWQQIKENALRNIAVKWGMSPKILSSFLAQGAQMTATQIDSEDDLCIAFIAHTRSYFKNALNELLETTLNYYGYTYDVECDFASPSLLNKDRLLERTIKMLENGLIDIEEALRLMNPDMDEEALQAKIDIAKKQREQMMLSNEFNQEGEFDLGGTTFVQ